MKILLFLLTFLSLPLMAGNPEIDSRFTDFASKFTAEQATDLESKLERFEKSTGHQFVVAVFPKLEGDLEQTTIELARQWKIGDATRNDGILFAIFLQSPSGGGKMRFEVGYGLEGQLTDGKLKVLLDTKIKPLFKEKKFVEGIEQAINDIRLLVDGKEQIVEKTIGSNFWFWVGLFIIIILVWIFLMAFMSGGSGRHRGSGSSGSSYSSWSSGSSSSSGGGGWSGGGGDFGGGGSSSDF